MEVLDSRRSKTNSLTSTGAKQGSIAADNGGETIAGGNIIFIDDQKGETKKTRDVI